MCGRFAIETERELIEKELGCEYRAGPLRHYNLAPGAEIAAAVRSRRTGEREIHALTWGLLPSWQGSKARLLFNARIETAAQKPSFRGSWRRRRCIVPASGFYEWTKDTVPYALAPASGLLLFAALWASQGEDGAKRPRCAILTAQAPAPLDELHHRCPAVISPQEAGIWLDSSSDLADIATLPRALDPQSICWAETSSDVNRASCNEPDLLRGIGAKIGIE